MQTSFNETISDAQSFSKTLEVFICSQSHIVMQKGAAITAAQRITLKMDPVLSDTKTQMKASFSSFTQTITFTENMLRVEMC